MSRIIERRFRLDDSEKERFIKTMRLVEAFSGVTIIDYSILNNHFHLVLEVLEGEPVPEDVVISRVKLLYGNQYGENLAQQVQADRASGNDAAAELLLKRYSCRMNNLSVFMKELLQRFTQSYNSRHNRKGTLWEQRFTSVLVEGRGHALAMMAAYVDLNAVRAGLVDDPKDYRYCGYAEALAGGKLARAGLRKVLESLGQSAVTGWGGDIYRKFVFMQGITHAKQGTSSEGFRRRAEEVLAKDGKLSAAELVHCRVRYFSDGVAFGSKEFVEQVFGRYRDHFGKKRKSGARPLKRTQLNGLYTMRDLRIDPIGIP
jgi:REP element-mobilizing transposase RayT